MKTIQELQPIFNHYLQKQSFDKQPKELYEPFQYMLGLGGKRMRPVLVLLGCEMFCHEAERALPQAMAIELFHNFTLLHDDIMDDAPVRRGQPTVQNKFGRDVAILSGDNMLVHAYEFLLRNAHRKSEMIFSLFNKTAIEVCEGQQWDLNFEREKVVSSSQYLKMIELKTAVLIGCALKMGAIIGGANAEDAQRLYETGRKLGIAFQLQDDMLDSFGNAEKFGKQQGGDIIRNKKTFLLIEALEKSSPEQKKNLESWLSKKDFDAKEKVNAVLDTYNELNIHDAALNEMKKFYDEAMADLDEIDLPEMSKVNLRNFAAELAERES